MLYNPEIHKRKSIRLKGYDYSREGLYFVTICTYNRENLFGKITNNPVGANLCVRPKNECEMILNNAGLMIEKWIKELSNKYKNIRCNEYVIMPNHIHCVIEIVENRDCFIIDESVNKGEHVGSPLPEMVKWFKTMTTNEYIKMVKNSELPNFDKHIWQRNYYENIIRNDEIYQKISEYIINNPIKWEEDKYYK